MKNKEMLQEVYDVLFEFGGGTINEITKKTLAHVGRKRSSKEFGEEVLLALLELNEMNEVVMISNDSEETEFYRNDDFYVGSTILVTLTTRETQGKFFMLGHRFLPYYCLSEENPLPIIRYRGKELNAKVVEMSFDEVSQYFSLFGLNEQREAVSVSIGALGSFNSNSPSGDDIGYIAYDLSDVLPNNKFNAKLSFKLCRDPEGYNYIDLVDCDPVVDFPAVHEYVEAMDELFAKLNDAMPALCVSEQLPKVHSRLSMRFIKQPPLSLADYFKMSKYGGLKSNGAGLTFYDKKSNVPEDILEENMSDLLLDIADDEINNFALELEDDDEFDEEPEAHELFDVSLLKDEVYTIKVAFDNDSNIYREISVHSKNTWDDLHREIIRSVGFENDHHYSFFLTGKVANTYRKRVRAPEISSFSKEPEVDGASLTFIGEKGITSRMRLYYLFDFGDEWWFDLKVKRAIAGGDVADYPKVIKSVGKAPEQYPDYDF